MARPTRTNVQSAIAGLRINENITTAMLPSITFSPTLGITARRVDKLGMDIRSFREPLKRAIQQVVSPSIQKNFDESGRPTSWEPLSEATKEIQQRLYGNGDHDPLLRTGKLRQVFGQFNIWTVTQDSAILKDIPPSVPYAAVQQAGYKGAGTSARNAAKRLTDKATRGSAKRSGAIAAKIAKSKATGQREAHGIPARPFVMLQEADIPEINKVFEKWLMERVVRNFPR
jgi:phage gpG-like protein